MSVVICDSSSLISLSETCNIEALGFLSKNSRMRFYISPAVEKEIIFNPLNYTQHAFSAMRLKKQVLDGVLKVASANPKPEYDALYDLSNHLFSVNGNPLKILQAGELECMAVYRKVRADAMLVDEKTARLVIESPRKLLETLRAEYRSRVDLNESAGVKLEELLSGVKVFRSSELLALAYGKGFFDGYKPVAADAFHAAEYAARNAGCSISAKELAEYEKLK